MHEWYKTKLCKRNDPIQYSTWYLTILRRWQYSFVFFCTSRFSFFYIQLQTIFIYTGCRQCGYVLACACYILDLSNLRSKLLILQVSTFIHLCIKLLCGRAVVSTFKIPYVYVFTTLSRARNFSTTYNHVYNIRWPFNR